MSRKSDRSRVAAALLSLPLAYALFAAAGVHAQDPAPSADRAPAPAAAAAADEQPRRGRNRRRDSETAAIQTQPPATNAAVVADADAAPPAETVEAKIICKSIKPTGSKMARRVCGTPEQWAAAGRASDEKSDETMRQIRDRTRVVVSQPDNPLNPNN